MSKSKTLIDGAKFQKICQDLGLPVTPMTGWIKISGAKGRNVYVARQDQPRAVHISGFSLRDEDGNHQHGFTDPDGPNGRVEQHIDFSLTEDEILDAFSRALLALASLPPAEKTRRSTGKKDTNVQGWSFAKAE